MTLRVTFQRAVPLTGYRDYMLKKILVMAVKLVPDVGPFLRAHHTVSRSGGLSGFSVHKPGDFGGPRGPSAAAGPPSRPRGNRRLVPLVGYTRVERASISAIGSFGSVKHG